MEFDLDFPRAYQGDVATGVIKSKSEDFYVEEQLGFEPEGSGEHVWLWLEKNGQNTEYVAKQIARFAGVRTMDVGFSGLKDRWAVTRQWFSIYMGNKPEPVWDEMALEGVKVIRRLRHTKKLRRGEHQANLFRLVVKNLENTNDLEDCLAQVKEFGFPNYFGLQRFGQSGSNLSRGEQYFSGEIKASRSQRSFYLSAARSYLYNLNLSSLIQKGLWKEEVGEGPLYGDPQAGVAPITKDERDILDQYPVFQKGIHDNRLKLERRPYRIVPEAMLWNIEDDMLTLEFLLPAGVFATALLQECMAVTVAQGVM